MRTGGAISASLRPTNAATPACRTNSGSQWEVVKLRSLKRKYSKSSPALIPSAKLILITCTVMKVLLSVLLSVVLRVLLRVFLVIPLSFVL